MESRWMYKTLDDEPVKFNNSFWIKYKEVENSNDVFWTELIKQTRENPIKRLEVALSNLPFPAAFEEGCKAIRAMIRLRKKNKDDYNEELDALYQLALIYTMMIPYSENLQMPGYNVMEIIPGNILFNLDIDYKKYGYKKIPLLGKNDIKELVKMYGEPMNHSTMNEEYKIIWAKYEDEFKKIYNNLFNA